MPKPTAPRFVYALNKIGRPTKKPLQFLREHYYAPKRARTARQLAESVNYKNHGGINLQYGKLAHRIGEELRVHVGDLPQRWWLSLLVEFRKPRSGTNKECILKMHKEFAEALKTVGLV